MTSYIFSDVSSSFIICSYVFVLQRQLLEEVEQKRTISQVGFIRPDCSCIPDC